MRVWRREGITDLANAATEGALITEIAFLDIFLPLSEAFYVDILLGAFAAAWRNEAFAFTGIPANSAIKAWSL